MAIIVRKYLDALTLAILRERCSPGMCACDSARCIMCRPLIG